MMAKRIIKITRESEVSIVENRPPARALYRDVGPGEVIPPELFRAVAEVLAFVFRQRAASSGVRINSRGLEEARNALSRDERESSVVCARHLRALQHESKLDQVIPIWFIARATSPSAYARAGA
jgi:hypothetical protein